jgi:hypothetical protein
MFAALALTLFASPSRAQDAAPTLPPPPPPPLSGQPVQPAYSDPGGRGTGYAVDAQAPVLSRRELKRWHDGDPVPPGYHPVQKPLDGLIIAGATTLAVPYFFSAATALASRNSQDQLLYAPVLGPFLRIQDNNPNSNFADFFGDVLLVFDGVVQTAGAVMLIIGATTTKTVLVRNDTAWSPIIVPMRFGNDGYGVGVVSQF